MAQSRGRETEPTRLEPRCNGSGALELRFPSCPEYLAFLRLTAKWYAKRCGFSDKECGRIELALVEAVKSGGARDLGFSAAAEALGVNPSGAELGN